MILENKHKINRPFTDFFLHIRHIDNKLIKGIEAKMVEVQQETGHSFLPLKYNYYLQR